jgi:hypothetical protein
MCRGYSEMFVLPCGTCGGGRSLRERERELEGKREEGMERGMHIGR